MFQVSDEEFIANLNQLAELVPIEIAEGEICHGLVFGNISVGYVNERAFLSEPNELQRMTMLRKTYVNCLQVAIREAQEKLVEVAKNGVSEHFKNSAKQIWESMEKGSADIIKSGDNDGEETEEK